MNLTAPRLGISKIVPPFPTCNFMTDILKPVCLNVCVCVCFGNMCTCIPSVFVLFRFMYIYSYLLLV